MVGIWPRYFIGHFVFNHSGVAELVGGVAGEIVQGLFFIYWIDGNNSFTGNIFAYGNPVNGQPKILYQPYGNGVANYTSTCLTVIGKELCLATNNFSLYLFNVSTATTRGTLNITSLNATLEGSYNYEYTKVSCGQQLSSGHR